MNHSQVHLLHLPNEILFIILKKLDNKDVLYSLSEINNERLYNLVQNDVFTHMLNFVTTSSITDAKLDRFCTSILPRIHHTVRKLILQTISIERILRPFNYPNLTYLELFNFDQEIARRYFTNDSIFQQIFKQQITDLILHNNDQYTTDTCYEAYTTNIYAHILVVFENLKRLTVVPSSVNEYPPLVLWDLPPTTCFSSTLTVLCINVFDIDDCFSLLDGRLKQLNTLIVQIDYIRDSQLISRNMDELHNLKCFSLTSYDDSHNYDDLIVPLLRRMTHLEKLTLYLRIRNRSAHVDGRHLQNEILVHMPRLHTFVFYLSTENNIDASVHRLSVDDIQRTFTNIKYGQTASIVHYLENYKAMYHVFSLPFIFTRLENIGNQFLNIVFDNVTHLSVIDMAPFKHEFFMRIGRMFPLLRCFCVSNVMPQSWTDGGFRPNHSTTYSVIEYPHLTTLDITSVDIDYVVQFLHETKAHVPCLTELKVKHHHLKCVTMNFTRDATRRNCAQVKRLIFEDPISLSKDVYKYFPSLSIE